MTQLFVEVINVGNSINVN